jgi:hypothetical protein
MVARRSGGDDLFGRKPGGGITTKRFALGVFVLALALAAPAVAQANEVTKWNAVAQTTVLSQPPVASAPPAAGVFMAMVQGTVYGAVNAIDRHHRPYLVYRRVKASASKEAAVATAAFEVLDELFPAQHTALRTQYDDSLAAIPDGALKQAGIAAGHEAADAMLAEGHDGRLGPIPPLPPVGVGYWQPLLGPSGPLLDPTPWVALARPFLVKSNSQFRTAGPIRWEARPTPRTSMRSRSSARWTARPGRPHRPTPPSSGRPTRRRTGTASSADWPTIRRTPSASLTARSCSHWST